MNEGIIKRHGYCPCKLECNKTGLLSDTEQELIDRCNEDDANKSTSSFFETTLI